MIAKDKIFREYDIRGVVGSDFDESFAYELGRAFAEKTYQELGGNKVPTIAVGMDCRLSREAISQQLIAGLRAGGINVLACGMGPTPQLYFTVVNEKLDGGIQVTASHNPSEYNGFKMMIGEKTLSGDDIQDLKNRLDTSASSDEIETSLEEFDARKLYIEDLVERSQPHVNPEHKIKVVVDGGNGVGGLVGPEVLKRLGCEVIELYTEPDGTFPNHHPDPTELENIIELRQRVIDEGADLGIGWDGDADRIGVVDENGEPIFGDMLLVVFGMQIVKEVDNPIIIGDVKCSDVMFSYLEEIGAKPVMAKTGHSLIKKKMKELNAHLAGEMSGHMFFAHRYFGFDDAMHASARLIEILSHSDQTLSELLAVVPKTVSTPEIRINCDDSIKFDIPARAKEHFSEFEVNTLDGIRISFPGGWGLVRASNTQPALVLRFEADTEENLKDYRERVEGVVLQVRDELS